MVDELFEVFEDLFERRGKKKKNKDRAEAPVEAKAPPAPPVFCMDCGARNEGSQRFCQECGKLLPSAGEEMRCPRCSTVVPLTAKFCGRCGSPVA
ncbi:MAG: zinc ribbon domain-containing protein [Dehalococcoidia bacterium]|nr:zinc ribbon domain-containing protein [Dehalococcoidia bacterium]